MKQCIFASSNSLIRGSRLAPKAGLFYFPAKGVFRTYKAAACHYRALRSVSARESGLFDSGIWWAAFLSTYVKQSSHAHRDQIPRRSADIPRTPDHTGQSPTARPRNGAATAGDSPRTIGAPKGDFSPPLPSIIPCNSVF